MNSSNALVWCTKVVSTNEKKAWCQDTTDKGNWWMWFQEISNNVVRKHHIQLLSAGQEPVSHLKYGAFLIILQQDKHKLQKHEMAINMLVGMDSSSSSQIFLTPVKEYFGDNKQWGKTGVSLTCGCLYKSWDSKACLCCGKMVLYFIKICQLYYLNKTLIGQ